jgi:serine/threonine protein kinase
MLVSLHHLHETNRLAHQDIRPSNIVITDDFGLSFIDFAHAMAVDSIHKDLVGTKAYNPPEVIAAAKYPRHLRRSYHAEKVDIFSAGVTIFMLVFGYNPFDKADPSKDPMYRLIADG